MILRRIKQVLGQEKGASLIYFALVLFILLGMASIALDGSNAYVQRRRMQTAADAAALAGARTLALGGNTSAIDKDVEELALANGVGNLPWTLSGDGKSVQASAPGEVDAEWDYSDNNKSINVTVNNDYDTYFARILGYNTLQSAASSKAGYEPIVGADNLVPLAINGCDCLEFDQFPVVVDQDDFGDIVTAVYAIGNVKDGSLDYSVSLKNLDSAYPSDNANPAYYMFYTYGSNGVFTEYGNGTARGTHVIANANGDGFLVDMRFTGRTTTPPDGQSPACAGACPTTTDWHYYPTTEGTLTGLPGTRYEGAVIQVTRRGAALQVGTNAHLTSPISYYGAAGALALDVLQQPTTGVVLTSHNEEAATSMLLLMAAEDAAQPTATAMPEAATPTLVSPTQAPASTATFTSVPAPATATPVVATGTCLVTYQKSSDWGNGFVANLTITNQTGATFNGWTMTWTFAGNQTITSIWNANLTQAGQNVQVTNASWNGPVSNGGTVTFGFQASYSGANATPANFVVNGIPCNASVAFAPSANGPTPSPAPIAVADISFMQRSALSAKSAAPALALSCPNNLLLNPSFEQLVSNSTTPLNWSGNARTADTAGFTMPDGARYGYHYKNDAVMYQDVTVQTGGSYNVSFYSSSHVPGVQTVKLQYLTSANAAVGTAQVHYISKDVDTDGKFGGPYTLTLGAAPATAAKLRVSISANGTDWAKVDAFCLQGVVPTATRTPTATATATRTSTATATATKTPTVAATATRTPIVPTATATKTATSVPTATATSTSILVPTPIPTVVQSCPSNLILNPSFEQLVSNSTTPLNWSGSARSANTAGFTMPDGARYGYHYKNDAVMYQDVTVQTGGSYSVSFYSSSHVPGVQTVKIQYLTSANIAVGTAQVHYISKDVDTDGKFGGPYTLTLGAAPATAAKLRVSISANGTDWAKVDAFCLQGVVPTATATSTTIATATATNTPITTASATATPTATATKISTVLSPTATPTFLPTATATATVPPTATATATVPPTATATTVPITPPPYTPPPPSGNCALDDVDDAMYRYSLIVLDDLATTSDIENRVFVGGNFVSSSLTNIGINVSGVAPTEAMFVVVGDLVAGNPINLNAGSLRLGGNHNNRPINFNGGGSLIQDTSLSDGPITGLLQSATAQLAAKAPNNGVTLPSGQPGPAKFQVTTTTSAGVAIFQIAGSELFGNGLVQQIELDPGAASLVVINVTGSSIDWSGNGNMVGNFTNSQWRSHVIWNFPQATSINLGSHNMMGAILAPYAAVTTSANLDGSVAVRALTTSAEVHQPTFSGDMGALCEDDETPPTGGTPCQLAWLDWNGGLASTGELADDLADPSRSGVHQVGEVVDAGPAVENVQQVTDALEQWLNKPMTMVLYDDGDQQNGYQICGFAEFTMTEYDFSALPKWIQGQFNLSITRGATDPNADDYGLRGIRFK